jgi:parallel beta-helix repeat protein
MVKISKTGALGSAVVLAGGSASALLLALTAAPGGAATTLTIDSLADGAETASDCTTPVVDSCSLRDALAAAADGDVITFKSGLAGTIILSEGMLDINAGLTLTGAGSASITIDANSASNVFYIRPAASDVTISGLSIINAIDDPIYAQNIGDLALTDVNVSGNSGNYGGALYISNEGAFTLTDSTISNNTASNGGGGIYLYAEVTSAVITNTTISGNNSNGKSGGGIKANFTGDLTIIDSTISNNAASSDGGGVFASDTIANVTITDSTVSGNTADSGGAAYLYNSGSVTIAGSTFDGNSAVSWGGALYIGIEGKSTTISDSTFSNNTSDSEGGAIDFDGYDQIVTINNTTIVGNTAGSGSGGGGIWKDEGGSLTINQSTITENSAYDGGGIYVNTSEGNSGSVTLSGTIVSANTITAPPPAPVSVPSAAALNGPDIAIIWVTGNVLSLDHSLVGLVNATSESNITDLGGNVRSSTPGLSALADNGGMTQTMALLSTSAAVDAGPSPVATFVGNEFDQRGAGYARVVGARVDIGAFEIQPPPAPTPTTAPEAPVVPTFAG